MNRRSLLVSGAGFALAGLVAAACGSDDDESSSNTTPAASTPAGAAAASPAPTASVTSATKAADLRVALNNLLSEHVVLAASATGAALAGRMPQFEAVAASLDENSVDLSKAIGSVYGAAAEEAFLPLWRKHIGFFVDYTQGVATKDQAKQDKAVADLTQYTQDFGAFLNSAAGLPKDTVAKLVQDHVLGLKTVVDAQAAGNQPKVYDELRASMAHMQMVADPLAEATVKKFPEKFSS